MFQMALNTELENQSSWHCFKFLCKLCHLPPIVAIISTYFFYCELCSLTFEPYATVSISEFFPVITLCIQFPQCWNNWGLVPLKSTCRIQCKIHWRSNCSDFLVMIIALFQEFFNTSLRFFLWELFDVELKNLFIRLLYILMK